MPVIHFTDIAVSALKTPGTYYDDATPAFGIRVGKNRKTWLVIRGRERLRTNIGRYPQLTLAEARKEAKKVLTQELVKGSRLSLNQAYEQWKATLTSKRPRTQYDYARMMEKHLIPKLGKKKLPEVTYEDVTDITSKLAQSEGAHCLSVARTFFRWCVKPPRRFIPHSPIEGVEVKLGKKRKRILKPPEIKTVWQAAAKQGYPHGTIVQLLLLTGQRRGEIANLRRTWINDKEQTITLPDWVTKNKKEHTFPFDGMVADILETVPRRNSTDLLFPSIRSDERPISGWSKYKRDLAAGVTGWTLHDLRRTYRSTHGQIGTPREIAERLINHAAGVTTDVELVYDIWTYLPQMRTAVEAYEAHLRTLLAA